jgi:hypothetical protein
MKSTAILILVLLLSCQNEVVELDSSKNYIFNYGGLGIPVPEQAEVIEGSSYSGITFGISGEVLLIIDRLYIDTARTKDTSAFFKTVGNYAFSKMISLDNELQLLITIYFPVSVDSLLAYSIAQNMDAGIFISNQEKFKSTIDSLKPKPLPEFLLEIKKEVDSVKQFQIDSLKDFNLKDLPKSIDE